MSRLLSFVLLLSLTFACQAPNTNDLYIATAANTQFAMEEIVADFESKHNWNCHVILGSSGKLTAQIEQGAPYDVFLSADETYPNYLIEKDKAKGPAMIYARGSLVLWALNAELPEDFSQLSESNFTIAMANPASAPYGRAAKYYLEEIDLWEEIQPKLVFGESISQVNQMLVSGAIDYAFTAESVVSAKKLKEQGIWVKIPEVYPTINQAAILLKNGDAKEDAKNDFLNYLQSESAKNIWNRFGYH